MTKVWVNIKCLTLLKNIFSTPANVYLLPKLWNQMNAALDLCHGDD